MQIRVQEVRVHSMADTGFTEAWLSTRDIIKGIIIWTVGTSSDGITFSLALTTRAPAETGLLAT
jgi:hypothetical protein